MRGGRTAGRDQRDDRVEAGGQPAGGGAAGGGAAAAVGYVPVQEHRRAAGAAHPGERRCDQQEDSGHEKCRS